MVARTVKSVISTAYIELPSDIQLTDAARMMIASNVNVAIVIEKDQAVGLVFGKDICKALSIESLVDNENDCLAESRIIAHIG